MESIYILLLVIILVLLVWLILRKNPSSSAGNFPYLLQMKEEEHRKALLLKDQEHDKTLNYLKAEKLKLEDELSLSRNDLLNERSRMFRAEEAYKAQRQTLAEQSKYIEELHHKFKLEFENIASKILDDKSSKFAEQNKNNLDTILNPLKENIKAFEEKVNKVYKDEAAERNVLKGVINQLMDQSKQIQEDANNLTKALKGDTKKQGNWGEVILERVLERSGLIKDREFRIQASLTSPDGRRLQPDVVIDLPDEKHIVIDSKVSLIAYERSITAETDEERDIFVKQHINSLKSHVQELSAKAYQELYQIQSPDFILLFVPIESSFSLAIQKDAELFNFAWDRKVVIVSPSTLLATLRTIASMWKQEKQTRNVLEIARLSGSMYDKFVGFVSDMENIGKYMRQGNDAYEKAMNKLSVGSGNLASTSEKIRKLGAKATKQIENKYLEDSLAEEDNSTS